MWVTLNTENINKLKIMKHSKNYMDAMWVIQNPDRYDERDVVNANSFIDAYNEGYNRALNINN